MCYDCYISQEGYLLMCNLFLPTCGHQRAEVALDRHDMPAPGP